MHRCVWEYYKGPIPKGYEVHHADFDRSNNDISNLRLLNKSKHRKLHGELLTNEQRESLRQNLIKNAQPEAIRWHKSEAGRQWHSKLIEEQRERGAFKDRRICVNCGKEYIGEKHHKNNFCSNACKSAYRRKSGVDNVQRVCAFCGKPFMVNKYKLTKTCSRSCTNRYRNKLNRRGN